MVTVYIGKSKIQFAGDKRIFINEKQIDSSTLGTQLMFHTQQTIFRDTSNMANVAMNIYENLDKICEIDYGKAIMSNVFEGVGVYLFKKDDKIFINKVNPTMNENSFVKANALQTVNLVKKFLSFNMSESLNDFLEGDYKKKAVMEGDMNNVLANIQILEGELDKIEKAILEDPSFADVKEVADAKAIIESELNGLKSQWQEMSGDLKKFETVTEEEEEETEEEIIPEPDEEEEEVIEEPKDDDEAVVDDEVPADTTTDTTAEPASEPAATELATSEEPGEIESAIAVQNTGLVDTGLLGAGGSQAVATAIPGNDHLDANATAGVDSTGGTVLDAGLAGAAGGEHQKPQVSDEIKQEVAPQPVITPGAEAAQVIPGAVSNDIPVSAGGDNTQAADNTPVADATADVSIGAETTEAPVDGEAPVGDKEVDDTEEVVVDVKGDKEADETADDAEVDVEGDEKEEVKESKKKIKMNSVSESIGVDSKVKDKVSGKNGTVTAMSDEKFTILLDDGEPVERTLSDLEDVGEEIEQNIAKNEEPVNTDARAETTDVNANENEEAANADGEEGKDTEKENSMYVKATLTIDLGPFKAGDEVEIDAANYTSTGDDEPIKLKEPKEGVSEIPKKYLTVTDNPGGTVGNDVDSKVASVLQQIQDLETFLQDNNTKGNKAIEDAKSKIKKFAASLKDETETETETEEKPDDKSGEEAK
jgi:hypothetical protein